MEKDNMIQFPELLRAVQKYLSESQPDALKSKENREQVKPYIRHYLISRNISITGMNTDELTVALYNEMSEYAFLTSYMQREDVDEININSWDNVVITYSDGRLEKIQSFFSPDNASDIVKRMLQHSRTVIDDAVPVAEGQLPNNTRIMVMKSPVVANETYISASIRMLHPSRITATKLVANDCASDEMVRFLCCCMRFGVSFVVAGATFSGKTTLLNALLKTLPNEKRIFTIEAGTRELDLVRRNEQGEIINNVIHTLAKKAEEETHNISMEKLVVASLRYNPDLIVVGEMRDAEAYAAIDASLTGHTLVSTIHSFAGAEAHMRLATLCQKRFPMSLDISLMQAAKAFPVVCFEQKLEDGSRKITNISECEVDDHGNRIYHTLFRYVVEENTVVDGKMVIKGHYEKGENMSNSLRERMIMFGIPSELLAQIDGRKEV